MSCERRELVRRAGKWLFGKECDLLRCTIRKLWVTVETSANRSSAECEREQAVARVFDSRNVSSECCGMRAELLSERQWHRILEVGPSNLDNGCPGLRLGRNGAVKLGEGGDQLLVHCKNGGNVNCGGEDVIGGLREVDVVVWVYGRLSTSGSSGDLVGARRDDLVDIHVALRP